MSMSNEERLRQVNENMGPFNRHVGLIAEAFLRGSFDGRYVFPERSRV